jgi:hypothetical protein
LSAFKTLLFGRDWILTKSEIGADVCGFDGKGGVSGIESLVMMVVGILADIESPKFGIC